MDHRGPSCSPWLILRNREPFGFFLGGSGCVACRKRQVGCDRCDRFVPDLRAARLTTEDTKDHRGPRRHQAGSDDRASKAMPESCNLDSRQEAGPDSAVCSQARFGSALDPGRMHLLLFAPAARKRLTAGFRNDTPAFPHGFATIPPVSRRDWQQITEYPYFDKCSKTNDFPPSFQSDTSSIQPKISTSSTDAPPPRRTVSRQRPIRVNPCPMFRQPLINQPLADRPSRQNTRNTACRAAHHHPRTNQDPTFGTPRSPPPGKPERTRFINA